MELRLEHNRSSLVLPAKYSALWTYVGWIEDRLPTWARRDMVRVGIAEALSNAMIHGALAVDCSLRDAGHVVEWLAVLEEAERAETTAALYVSLSTRSNSAQLRVDGGGRGFDWRNAEPRVGRGLSIIRAAFDHVCWNDSGTVLFATINKP
jgi:hypothetical protein